MSWYPYTVTWSPDGATLLYAAWSDGDTSGVIAVPADTPSDVTVLTDAFAPVSGDYYSHRWVRIQMWGRR